MKLHISSISHPTSLPFERRPVTCFPDKIFGAGENRCVPSEHNIKAEFQDDLDCWLLILEMHMSSFKRGAPDDPQVPYSFAHIKDRQIVQSLDFSQFLTELGFGDRDRRPSDIAELIAVTEEIINTVDLLRFGL